MQPRIKKGDPKNGPPGNVEGPPVLVAPIWGPGQGQSVNGLITYDYSKNSADLQAQTANNLIQQFEKAKAGMRDAVDPDIWVEHFLTYCRLWPFVFAAKMEEAL